MPNISYVGLKIIFLVLNEVTSTVYREIYLSIGFTDLPHPYLSRSSWRNNARLLGFATLCANLQKTTLPPLSFSPSPLFFTNEIATIVSMPCS